MSAKFQEKQEKDLFEQFQGSESKVNKKTRLLIPRIKDSIIVTYENTIFIAITFLIACIICFSLGVEKGRQDRSRLQSIGKIAVLETGTLDVARGKQDTENIIPDTKKAGSGDKGYVVQLAAFKNREPAEREAEKLRKDGYAADIKKSDEYYQLYIGTFNNKEEAERLRGKLKNRYSDCYVK